MAFNTSDDDSQERFALGIIFALVILVVTTVVGAVVYKQVSAANASAPVAELVVVDIGVATVTVPPSLAAGAVQQGDGAYIRVEEGVVKFYFATGSAELAPGAEDALANVVRIANDRNKKLAVSGFHDATGDAAQNAEVSKRRAQAVQQALVAMGVPAANVELRKPTETQADGSNAEARRVEVVVIE